MDAQVLDIFLFSFTTIGWLVAYIEAIVSDSSKKHIASHLLHLR